MKACQRFTTNKKTKFIKRRNNECLFIDDLIDDKLMIYWWPNCWFNGLLWQSVCTDNHRHFVTQTLCTGYKLSVARDKVSVAKLSVQTLCTPTLCPMATDTLSRPTDTLYLVQNVCVTKCLYRQIPTVCHTDTLSHGHRHFVTTHRHFVPCTNCL
jgi:hypothetical protein